MSRIGMTTLTLLTLLMTGCMAAVESEYGFSEEALLMQDPGDELGPEHPVQESPDTSGRSTGEQDGSGGAGRPTTCSPNNTGAYCGCIVVSPDGHESFSGKDGITEVGCDWVPEGWTMTPCYSPQVDNWMGFMHPHSGRWHVFYSE